MKNNLNHIKKPIEKELKQFEEFFRANLKTKVGLLDLITKYLLKQKGKKVRPILVLLSAGAVGEISERSFRGAALVEMLHSATLIHDDVVDNAEQRRGLPSINAIWKNKVAVLMGDYLLSRGLLIAVENGDYDFLKTITKAVKRMSEGELLQINKSRKLDIDEPTYFKIISDKTASLISTCCEIGARSATTDLGIIEKMRDFGESIGIAFQIRDDILDYIGTSSVFGKKIGLDILDKKITLPLIYSLLKASPSESNLILKQIKAIKKSESVNTIIDFVKRHGGIEYAEKVAQDYVDKAKNLISSLEDSGCKNSLFELIDFFVDRKS
ncbi:MAG: polyprenyl synthetase family protein [Ignavibacteriales bacterium]